MRRDVMKRLRLMVLALPLAVACKSSTEPSTERTGPAGTGGIQVVGVVTGTSSALAATVAAARFAHVPFDSSPSCPATQSNSFRVTPTAYRVMLKRLTLLGSVGVGTANHDLIPPVTLIADGKEVNFVSDSVFMSSTSLPPVGTYNGIAIEVFYIAQQIPLVIPAVNVATGADTFAVASYLTRGYFARVGNIEPRDVTIFTAAGTGTTAEYWINRQTDINEPYSLAPVTGSHPFQTLDLWHDPNFWCAGGLFTDGQGCTNGWRDPMTICTRATGNCDPEVQRAGFTFRMADTSSALVIPAGANQQYKITLNFNIGNKFTFFGNVNHSNPATQAFGTFRVGYDCGYRIFFPDVSISITSVSP